MLMKVVSKLCNQQQYGIPKVLVLSSACCSKKSCYQWVPLQEFDVYCPVQVLARSLPSDKDSLVCDSKEGFCDGMAQVMLLLFRNTFNNRAFIFVLTFSDFY